MLINYLLIPHEYPMTQNIPRYTDSQLIHTPHPSIFMSIPTNYHKSVAFSLSFEKQYQTIRYTDGMFCLGYSKLACQLVPIIILKNFLSKSSIQFEVKCPVENIHWKWLFILCTPSYLLTISKQSIQKIFHRSHVKP